MRLWSCGFELQSVTNGVEFDAGNGTGTKSISTFVKPGGAASLRVNPTADYWFMSHQFRASATSKVYFRFKLYIGTMPAGDISIAGLSSSATGNTIAQLKLLADGTLQLGYYDGSFHNVGSPSTALIPGVEYIIEISADDSVANNTITARLEGIEFATGNGNNLGNTSFIQLGAIFSADTFDVNFDDLAINDEASGGTQTSWPGNGSIVHLNPSAAGDNNSWVASTGNAWDCLDEVPPSDTDYVDTSTVNATSDYNLANSDIPPNATINVVAIGARHRNGTASATSAYALRVKKAASGTVASSGNIVPNTTTPSTHLTAAPRVYQLTTYLDPDGAAWTKTTLDSMQAGIIETVDSSQTIRITKLWAMVDFTPPKIEVLTENFNDNSMDTDKFFEHESDGGAVAETNTQLEILLAPTTMSSWAGFNSKYRYDLRESSASIKFVSATTGDTWLDLTLSNEALNNVDNFISIGIDVGNQMLQAIEEIDGADNTLNEIPYVPADHVYGRIRETGGTVYWEYSATGFPGSWTVLHSKAAPIPISNLYIVLDDYAYSNLTTPNTHILDDLNILPTPPATRALGLLGVG
jgi:hypothetical protein